MSVLKKLSAFVPTIEDTVGNFEVKPNNAEPEEAVAATAAPEQLLEPRVATEPVPTTPPVARERKRKSSELDDRLRIKGGGIDGRSLRRTGRTALMSIKVRPELPEAMKAVSFEDGITLGELMDDMWSAYLQRRQSRRARAGDGAVSE